MKLKRTVTPHKYGSDCWNLAIAQAVDKDYYLVRRDLDQQCAPDGSLNQKYTNYYLISHGYTFVDLRRKEEAVTISQVMTMFKSYKVVIASYERRKSLAHLSFAENYEHFTTSETDDSFNDLVFFVWVKFDKVLQ